MAWAHTARQRDHNTRILALALIGAGFMVLGVLAWILLPKAGPSRSSGEALAVPVKVSFPAPQINLTDLEGNPVSLADYSGQVVLVNNWATWCPPCRAEMPTLQAYFEDHRHKKFTVIAIEGGDPVSEVVDFVTQYGLTFPVWPDVSQKAMAAFRNDYLPSSYVLDRTGSVRLSWTGAISREMLEKYVTPLLEE